MKRIYYLITLTLLTSLLVSSCSDTTYAEELKQEKIKIADYIKRNNINVLTGVKPTDVVIWGENDYVLTESGLYFHLSKPGIGGVGSDSLEISNVVIPRYKQYTLDLVSDTISNWSTVDFPYPTSFIYGNTSESSTAFQEAASYMKRNESEAKIIVHSKIGFSEYMKPATPLGYDIKIKIQK